MTLTYVGSHTAGAQTQLPSYITGGNHSAEYDSAVLCGGALAAISIWQGPGQFDDAVRQRALTDAEKLAALAAGITAHRYSSTKELELGSAREDVARAVLDYLEMFDRLHAACGSTWSADTGLRDYVETCNMLSTVVMP